ncbi:MAG: protein-glutamine gamma-glutamyltransferase [Solirubrobacteraceae bacterium]|nr:protein-glutamine gamma-glutamyltransferase [Solirubrobacteraceae bacterium]
MSALAPPPGARIRPAPATFGAPPPAAPPSDGPALRPAVARGVAFGALAGFAALHWMALLTPGEPGRALTALLLAGGAALALLGAARLPRRLRLAAAALIAAVTLVLAMRVGGVPSALLRPSGWSELAAGISRGIAALPGVRVPYRGVEPWIRIVMPLGGTMLVAVAALLAFWPRRERLGWTGAALLALVVLYAVPAVAMDFTVEFLRGGILAVLVLAFLRLEKLRSRDAGAAAAVAVAVALGGLVAAPLLDRGQPWWDYESWALDASSAKSTAFTWDHRYGPLNWPRDGRELLRVRARRPAYWKVENLDGFDGTYWHYQDPQGNPSAASLPDGGQARDLWTQNIRVTIRNLRSPGFVTGGYATSIVAPTIDSAARGDGTFRAARPLHRGDAYGARIYSPQPTERQRRAGFAFDDFAPWPYLRLALPPRGRLGGGGVNRVAITFARFGAADQRPRGTVEGSIGGNFALARAALRDGPYAGVWRLSRRLLRNARTQEDFVGNVESYLRQGFSYTESPPTAAQTLPGFLLDAKTGYCQQFSGGMALLLRMGGVPARVATGFTSGALDRKTGEYVVRDLDAHSWVEVWYSGYGWVTFDPTPATAPPRSQPDEVGPTAGQAATGSARPPSFPGERGGIGRQAVQASGGTPWWAVALAVAGGLALAAAAWWAVRRRRRPPSAALSELERALRRTRRGPAPGTTLRTLEATLAGVPAAAGYVRAVREARYGGRPAAPTATERRALRSALSRGAGPGGRLRAWWALPPARPTLRLPWRTTSTTSTSAGTRS